MHVYIAPDKAQLPVVEKMIADYKIGFINMVNYCCVDGCISHGSKSNTKGIFLSVSIRSTFKIAVKELG